MIKRLEYHKDVFAINNLENDDLSLLKGSKSSWVQFLTLVLENENFAIYVKYDEDELLNYLVCAVNINPPLGSSIIIMHIANDMFLSDLLEQVDDLRAKKGAMEILIETTDEEKLKQYNFTKIAIVMKREI